MQLLEGICARISLMNIIIGEQNRNLSYYVVVVFCNLSPYHVKVYTKWQFMQPISHIATARKFGLIFYTCETF